jgi:Domain of unknown function (DUF397)
MEAIDPRWRTSSYTGNGGGNCVEVGDAARVILVRDTKDRHGPMLRFTPAAWRKFADQVKQSLATDLNLTCRRLKGPLSCLIAGEWPFRVSGVVSSWQARRGARAVASSDGEITLGYA